MHGDNGQNGNPESRWVRGQLASNNIWGLGDRGLHTQRAGEPVAVPEPGATIADMTVPLPRFGAPLQSRNRPEGLFEQGLGRTAEVAAPAAPAWLPTSTTPAVREAIPTLGRTHDAGVGGRPAGGVRPARYAGLLVAVTSVAAGMWLTTVGTGLAYAGWLAETGAVTGSALVGAKLTWAGRFGIVLASTTSLCCGPVLTVMGVLRASRARRTQRGPGRMIHLASFCEESFGGTRRDPATGRMLKPVRPWQLRDGLDDRAAWELFDGQGRRLGAVSADGCLVARHEAQATMSRPARRV